MCVKKELNLYVKFVSLNPYTLANIINKTIWFSTVYGFNDFNEENVWFIRDPNKIQCDIKFSEGSGFKNLLEENLEGSRAQLLNDLDKCHSLSKSERTELIKDLKEPNNETLIENHCDIITMLLAYRNTGIFCLSHINVFEDDAAQLMFAHYGNNLSGLALIYNVEKSLTEVRYEDDWSERSFNNCPEGVRSTLIEGNNQEYFQNKSKNWTYEQEYRIFNTPGIARAADHQVALKGIFYTERSISQMENLPNLLRNINDKFYDDKLVTAEVCRNFSPKRRFKVIDEETEIENVIRYLQQCKSL